MSTILQQIREGMKVCDSSGTEIGTVEFVRMGDENPSAPGPQTATVSPAVPGRRDSLVDFVAEAFQADEVPDVLRERLLRLGFVRVDVSGLFAADRYVVPDQIASVSGDRVMLAVGRDELLKHG